MFMTYRRLRRRNPVGDFINIISLIAVAGALTLPGWSSSKNLAYIGFIFVIIVVLVGLIILGVLYLVKKKRQAAFLALELVDTDTMTGREFEHFMAAIFRQRGYKVKETCTSGDYGVDLLIKKDGITTAVQLKRYQATVGLKAVQEAVAGMYYYKCDQSLVVTNSTFTKAARNLATANQCMLVGRDELAEWILIYKRV